MFCLSGLIEPTGQPIGNTLLSTMMLLLVSFSGCLQTNSDNSELVTPGQEEPSHEEQMEAAIPLSIAFIVDEGTFGTQNDPS